MQLTDLEFISEISSYAFPELQNCSIGDFFFENYNNDSISINNNVISRQRNNYEGFSLRKIIDDITYFHTYDDVSLNFFKSIYSNKMPHSIGISTGNLYPIFSHPETAEEQINLLKSINEQLRENSMVQNVILKLEIIQQNVLIFNNLNRIVLDQRPLLRLVGILIVKENDRTEEVYVTYSKRSEYYDFISQLDLCVEELLRQARISLLTQASPAGSFPIVLGSASCGVLLHEAIGHGLEADFNFKNISAFSNKLGEQICKETINIVDNGLLKNARGSINFDDEGMETEKTYLVKNGILNNYLCDRYYGEKLGLKNTGNGRRQSYLHCPIPRMRNTYMENGDKSLNELIGSINYGIYLPKLGGGQVDISSGDFSFNSAEAYLIENGKISNPIKDCVISGNGPKILSNIVHVGNDFKLDDCGGTCGKDGQWVPVGVGQPSILISQMIVGGTSL